MSEQIRTWHDKHLKASSFGARIADKVSKALGSWTYIIVQTTLIIIWITLNVTAYVMHWDPFPFILLNLVFSTQATYAAPIIIMAQNRQAERDRVQATDDYETNKAAKEEIEALQTHLSRLEVEKLNKIIELLEKNGSL